jgi:hypothetical protein
MRTNRAPTAEGRAARANGAGEPVHVLDCWQMLSALHGTDCIAASPTLKLSGGEAVRLSDGLGRTAKNANALMAERANLPSTRDKARRRAAHERSAMQRMQTDGGGGRRTNLALTAEGRTARADRDSEAAAKLDG